MLQEFLALSFIMAAACASQSDDGSTRNLIVSNSAPVLSLEIEQSFAELSPLRFPLQDLTEVDRRIFVDAGEDRIVRRLVVVQFEKVRQGSDFRFRYPSTPPRQFGEETYRFGAFGYDDLKAAADNPEKEAGRTRDHLIESGYTPPDSYHVARLARVSDLDGMTEVIIFYMENADGLARGPLDADGDWELRESVADALAVSMEQAVKAVSG